MSWLSKATGIHISPKGVHLSAPDPIGTVKDIAKNPLQPITSGVGDLVGVHLNKSGVHVDPLKLALTLATLPAGGAGSLLSKIPVVGGALASGAGELSHLAGAIPGVSSIGNTIRSAAGGANALLTKVPGVSSIEGKIGSMLGLGDAAGSGTIESAIPDSAMGLPAGGGGVMDKIGSMVGLGPNMTAADKLQLAKLGIDTIGGIAGGIQSGKNDAAALKERQREFDATQGTANANTAMTAARAASLLPAKTAANARLQGYLANPPAAFHPHDIFNAGGEGPGQIGGYDRTAVNATAAGVTNPNDPDEVYKRILAMTGFRGAA